MQDRRNTDRKCADRRGDGKEGCGTGEMQEMRDAGQVGCGTGGMQERRDFMRAVLYSRSRPFWLEAEP